MLEEIFAERPDWDKEGTYLPHQVVVYYETADRSQLYKVDVDSNLGTIIKGKG